MALERFRKLLIEHALRLARGPLQAPGRLLRLLLSLLLVNCEPLLDPGERGQEERRLLRLLGRLFRLVALLDDLEVEQGLPAGAREEGECDELAVELGRGREGVCGLVFDREGGECV